MIFRSCCGVYTAIVKQLPTERMWSLYLEALLELNQDQIHLPKFKKNLLREAFQGAHSAGCLQEKYYLRWVRLYTSLTLAHAMIKSMLKRRKKSGAYLTTDGRHRWSLKMTMKNDN